MFLCERIYLILLVIDGLLQLPLPAPNLAGQSIALILLIGQFLLKMFYAGIVLLALHAQLILQTLDGLGLVATSLQDIVLHTG
jgi:hypothetical protein